MNSDSDSLIITQAMLHLPAIELILISSIENVTFLLRYNSK